MRAGKSNFHGRETEFEFAAERLKKKGDDVQKKSDEIDEVIGELILGRRVAETGHNARHKVPERYWLVVSDVKRLRAKERDKMVESNYSFSFTLPHADDPMQRASDANR